MIGYIGRFKIKYIFIILLFVVFCVYYFQIKINYDNCPVIIWWTPLMWEDEKIIFCNTHPCKLTKNRSYKNHPNLKAYLFYGSNFDATDLPLPRDKIWAIIHEESPKNLALFLHNETHKLFNFTSTFSRYSDLPLPLQYLDNLNSITEKKYYADLDRKNKLLNELSPILYIQSDCDTPIERDNYVHELMKYIKIDSYGICLHNKDLPVEFSRIDSLDFYHEDLLKFVAKYKFTISFENAICDDYITEKLWRPLMVGSVPIYLGSPTVEDWLPNKKSAILARDFETPKELADFIHKLNDNDDLYINYLNHKLTGEIENLFLKEFLHFPKADENPITAFECFICNRIINDVIVENKQNSPIYNCPRPKKENPWYSHWKIGKCQAKALLELTGIGRNYTRDKFDENWKNYLKNDDC